MKGRDHSEGLGMDVTILEFFFFLEIEWEGVVWIHLAWDWDQ
jgi:hypothetical protein